MAKLGPHARAQNLLVRPESARLVPLTGAVARNPGPCGGEPVVSGRGERWAAVGVSVPARSAEAAPWRHRRAPVSVEKLRVIRFPTRASHTCAWKVGEQVQRPLRWRQPRAWRGVIPCSVRFLVAMSLIPSWSGPGALLRRRGTFVPTSSIVLDRPLCVLRQPPFELNHGHEAHAPATHEAQGRLDVPFKAVERHADRGGCLLARERQAGDWAKVAHATPP